MLEKNNYLKEISPDMTRTVNDLVNRDFENATKEEIEAYAQFQVKIALHADEVEQIRAARDEKIKQDKEDSASLVKASIDALNLLERLAQEKLKAVENGLEK